MSKGSWRRPAQVPEETVARNWQRIFDRPQEEEKREETRDDTGI
jgi:hypothetical protein